MTISVLFQKNRLSLLITCSVTSVLIHLLVGSYLYHHPLLLQSPCESLFGLSLAEPKPFPHESDVDRIDKNFLLEEVFSTVMVDPTKLRAPYDLKELPQGVALSPQQEQTPPPSVELGNTSSFSPLFDQRLLSQDAILKQMQEISPAPLFQALEEAASQAAHVEPDPSLLSIEIPIIEPMPPFHYEDLVSLNTSPLSASLEQEERTGLLVSESLPQDQENRAATPHFETQHLTLLPQEKKPTLFTPKLAPSVTSTQQIQIKQEETPIQRYDFPKLSPTASWDEDFALNVSIAPHPEGKGYVFALSLSPTNDLSSHRLKQNFYFVLDRSSSSQRHHFPIFKRATLKALASIQPEDGFNIFIIDKHLTKLSDQSLTASLKNRHLAEDFLDAQESATFLSGGDIYSSLTKILPLIPEDQEMHSAILLTDGQSSLGAVKKGDAFARWFTENEGKVTLYTAAAGRDNDLVLLDLLGTEGGGKLLYSDTHASFPRKLAKLILDLSTPLANHVEVFVKPQRAQSHIELYPAAYNLAPLYANEPYLILGEINELAPFDLIIEARHKEDWVKIDKRISFPKNQAIDPRIIKQWKKMQASLCYAKFLEEKKPSHLQEAKSILNQAQREIAFE